MASPAGPPGPDISQGPVLVGVTVALHVISLSLFATRIYTRVWPKMRLGLDDYFITAAVAFDMVEWVLLLISIGYGVGRHNYYVHPDDLVQAEKFLFLSQPPYAWALAFAKLSIAWMLLRIQRDQKGWPIFLYGMMVFVVLVAVTMNSFQLSIAKPLAAVWDHSIPDATFMDITVAQTSIYVTAAMTILTDVILSLTPIAFIMNIQRPVREKVALAFVMGLGVIASIASIVKTTLVKNYGITGDDLMDSVGITTWSVLEMQLGIIAACIPTLKQLFEKFLRRVGFMSTYGTKSRTGYMKNEGDNTAHQLSGVRGTKRDPKGTIVKSESFESSSPIYLQTTVRSGAAGTTGAPAMDHLSAGHSGPGGIQKQTTVSVRSYSKASDDDMAV